MSLKYLVDLVVCTFLAFAPTLAPPNLIALFEAMWRRDETHRHRLKSVRVWNEIGQLEPGPSQLTE